MNQEKICIHHWFTGGLIIELDPIFFLTHPPLGIGFEYMVCKNCGSVSTNQLYIPPHQKRGVGIFITTVETLPSPMRGKPKPDEDYLTVTQVASRLNIKENSVRIYIRMGSLRGKQVQGGQRNYWMVESSSVVEYENKHPSASNRRGYTEYYGSII